MSLIDKYKQYGFFNFFKRVALSILSRIGISYDRWLFCTQEIDETKLTDIIIDDRFSIVEMNLGKFKDSGAFEERKLKSFEERFEDPSFKAYGVYDKNTLAYYCWISLKKFKFSKNLYSMKLKNDQGLLFDAFCFRNYRGNKLHNYMNVFRVRKLLEFGKNEAVVVLLSQNTPARKSQRKAGFACFKVITTFSFFGIKKVITRNKKVNL